MILSVGSLTMAMVCLRASPFSPLNSFIGLDATTGQLAAPLHNFTATSKEALHLAMLALSVNGHRLAKIFVNPTEAIRILDRKMNTYQKWNRTYPGFGGYLPWVGVNKGVISPSKSWESRVPSLDNGEWVWSIYATALTLKNSGRAPELAKKYMDYFQYLASTSVMMFYNGKGLVRAEAKILDPYAMPSPTNYENNVANYFLDDPYEGKPSHDVLLLYLYLF